MTNKMNFDSLDSNVLEQVGSRRDMFRSFGTLGRTMAMAAVPLGLAVTSRKAFSQEDRSVEDVLRFALTLEYLEADFYERGVAASGLIPSRHRADFTLLRDHEVAHVRLLEDVLGLGEDEERPEFDFSAGGAFPDWNTSFRTFALLSQGFEDTGVRAYKGQAGFLMGEDALTTALQIHAIEARHAARVRAIRGEDPNLGIKQWIIRDVVHGPDALAPVYAGEDNVDQAGVNVAEAAGIDPSTASEAWDEPLETEAVLEIAGLFIVSDE